MTVLNICSRFHATQILKKKATLFIARNVTQRYVLPLHIVYLRMVSMRGEELANAVFKHIRQKVCCDADGPVLQMRAGKGELTKLLLDAGVKNLHIFEKRKVYHPALKELASKYAGNSTLHQRTFNEVFFEDNNIPLYDSPYLEASLPFRLRKEWKDRPSLTIIGANTTAKVMIVGLIHLSKNMMFYGMGRPQFILSLPISAWDKILLSPKKNHYQDYHTAGLLFPDFFEFEILGRIPAPVSYTSGDNSNHVSKEDFITISISPCKDLESSVDPEMLEEYLFFGTQTMNGKAKHSCIIPCLERWSPGSGKELIINGVNCFTQFTDLSPKEALSIFRIWRSLPYYKSSLFKYEYTDYKHYNKY